MSDVHRLKILRKPYLDLLSGNKTGEVRDCSDRDFKVGDSVHLMLVDETGNPTRDELSRVITHIQHGYGLPDDVCVLSYAVQPKLAEQPCRNDGRCEYAIQSGAEGNGHCLDGKCAMPQYTGTGSDFLDCILGVGGFASFGPLEPQPAAHLTIPGSVEWDGDNGTHSESNTHGESCAHGEAREAVREVISKVQLKALADACKDALPLRYMESHGALYIRNDHGIVFDVHQNRQFPEIMATNKAYADLALAANPATVLALLTEIEALQGLYRMHQQAETREMRDLKADRDRLKANNEALAAKLADSDSLLNRSREFVALVHKCCRKNKEYAPLHWQEMVELDRDLSATAPAKPKTCIECSQRHCHGVCVERGDQDYDRDQAARGGDQ